jgi:hypothetical protein
MPLPGRSPGTSRKGGRNARNTGNGLFSAAFRAGTLPFWCLCFLGGGLVAVLVDLDHIPRYVFGVSRLPVLLDVPHLGASRFLHPVSFLIGLGVFACAGGCLLVLVLRGLSSAMKARRIVLVREAGQRSDGQLCSGRSSEREHPVLTESVSKNVKRINRIDK